jgi:glycosyltransferase involved in cell wall biosynthesis
VVVPTYKNSNKFRYFMNLYTILQQEYDHYHVIIIDDASDDHTADKIEKEIRGNLFVRKKVTLLRN